MSDPQKLKPCPFCNGAAKLKNMQICEDAVETWVECSFCFAKTDAVEDAYADPDTAAFIWNRRATPPEDNTLKLVEAVLHEACRVVDADTYKHPTLSRADAVAAGVAGLHDAVRAWLSAQPPSAAISHGEDDNG